MAVFSDRRNQIVKGAYLEGAAMPVMKLVITKSAAPPIPPSQQSPFSDIAQKLAAAQRRLDEITAQVNGVRRLRRHG